MREIAESLSRPSEILRQIDAFGSLGHFRIKELMEGQATMAQAAIEFRERMAAIDLPTLLPHDRVADALAGIQVLSTRSEALRLTASTALEAICDYQSFAARQLSRALTDHPAVFSRRMVITDLAGDLLETTQSSWELFGLRAAVVAESPRPVVTPAIPLTSPTAYSHLNRQLAYLYKDTAEQDASAAFHRSTASTAIALGGEIVELIHGINESRVSAGAPLVISPTNRNLLAVQQITTTVAADEQGFGKIVDALYCLLYEGSGDAKRLTELMSDEELMALWWVKTLRTSLRHDVDHGDPRKARSRHVEIGDVYIRLISRRRPIRAAHWSAAQTALFTAAAQLLRALRDRIDPCES
jgi:hypothetical protein